MTLSWYSISISYQSGGAPFFTGYFSVNTTTNTIHHFVNSTSTTLNLLKFSSNDYNADYKFVSGNFTFGGTVIQSIPALDSTYNASEWSIWYGAGDTYPNLSYKDANTGNWYDITPYGTIFSFSVSATSQPANIPPTISNNYNIYIYVANSPYIFHGLLTVDDNTKIITSFTDTSSNNLLAFTANDNESDYRFINNKFTVNGTAISSIPALDATFGAIEWQFWLYNGINSLAYKDSSNTWKYVTPLGASIYNISTYLPASSGGNGSGNVPCFNTDTKILCLNKNFEEEYIPVQLLRVGDLVKTYLHGYRKIKYIGVNRFTNDPNNYKCCMYVMSKKNEKQLIEDLVITGEHSILVNYVERLERIKQNKILMSERRIDDKILLMASISGRFQKKTDNNDYVYYHFAVEDDNDSIHRKFGVWANGILAEIPCSYEFKSLNLRPLV